jgi:hypothetical protein
LDGTNQNCLICNNGYYKFNNNCLNLCPNDYYALDLTQSCIINCPSYTVADRVNKRCKNCLDDNLFLYNNKCISTKPDNTFICNRYFNVLDDCFESCKFCERKGNKTLMYCNECASGYYPLSDNSSQCYPQNTARTLVVDGYLWNEAESKFDKCYDSCKTCSSTDYTDLDHKCITCKDNYEVEGTKCVLSLGKTCAAAEDTCVANSQCTGTPLKCTCKENYEAEGTKCVLSLGKTCKDGDTCVANAECAGTTDKKCTCKANYTAKDNKCESNDTSGSSFLKVFVISFLSLLF